MVRRYDRPVKAMRILLWHGWLLEGTGSNIYTSKVAEVWRRQGHEVVAVCQQPPSPSFPHVDGWGTAGPAGVHGIDGNRSGDRRMVVIRPDIGTLLPVFVVDEYEGFEVKPFVDLEDDELATYLDRNVDALSAVAAWSSPDVVVAGHAMPGPVVARRALGEGAYAAKVHGSDLEYAIRYQDRFAALAREGLEAATAVAGASADVLQRTEAVVPAIAGRTHVVPPGVEIDAWRPRPRGAALNDAAERLTADVDRSAGRHIGTDTEVRRRMADRAPGALDELAGSYDQAVPDPDAPARLRALASWSGPVVGYVGKLIPQKGVERFVEVLALLGPDVHGLVVGFGSFREWVAALVAALDAGDPDAHAWLAEESPMHLDLGAHEVTAAAGLGERITFTGRLAHRHLSAVTPALDVLVVPSTLGEAFGMVAAEAAAAGVPPVVARHSALAEVARALEGAAGEPGMLSFEPGPGATHRAAAAVRRILDLGPASRRELGHALREYVVREWTWDRTADKLLAAAR
ncbi:MAG TPA: glycosyltransferase [Actinomycetota bacterium]|nr:glycosyltransferase [Actinomycetota bacterium]